MALIDAHYQVQLVYELCEIQMEDPARFRGLLKTEEDASSWVSTASLAKHVNRRHETDLYRG